ncbi:hypothetical protein [Methylobacterium brachythecii]|uniref:Uncharacterized protein n=1 Tax=Methylobacterium brachythecii TaxID=1176177 RepID=A0A7W6F9L8_9HYPH|nr:hypothetical protein [Methylobacterium brachythecii]MBB3905301.1 hypothetical protein [Methylobacterium brachythecii]GLS45925.1 hypothetical protein GCM10007884_39160 [Methylobacterium brachythecii]
MSKTALTVAMSALPKAVRACVIAVAKNEPRATTARLALDKIEKSERPGFNLTDGAREVVRLAEEVRTARRMRDNAHRGIGRRSSRTSPLARDRAVLARHLAAGITERPLTRSAERLRAASIETLRTGASAGSDWSMTAGAPAYEVTVEEVRDHYRGAFKGYSGKRDCHVVALDPLWWVRIRSVGDGSGVVDGRVVLDARRVVNVPGAQAVHEVLLVRQGRGYTVIVEQAILATWAPDVVTRHRTVRSAIEARVPEAIMERDRKREQAAIRAEAERRRLEEIDEDVLADLEI